MRGRGRRQRQTARAPAAEAVPAPSCTLEEVEHDIPLLPAHRRILDGIRPTHMGLCISPSTYMLSIVLAGSFSSAICKCCCATCDAFSLQLLDKVETQDVALSFGITYRVDGLCHGVGVKCRQTPTDNISNTIRV